MIGWNNHKRNIPFRDPPIPMSTEDNIKYCEPICRDYRSWNLPVMDPWSPSKHGIVESRHQIFVDITNFDFLDGAGGDWPIKPPKPKVPGGISTTGAGTIDYWEIDFYHGHRRKRRGSGSSIDGAPPCTAKGVGDPDTREGLSG